MSWRRPLPLEAASSFTRGKGSPVVERHLQLHCALVEHSRHRLRHHPCALNSHSHALFIFTTAGGSAGRASCVKVSSCRRARGNSLPGAASARPSRVAVAGSEVGAKLDQFGFGSRVPGEEVDLVAPRGPHIEVTSQPRRSSSRRTTVSRPRPGWPDRFGRRPGSTPDRRDTPCVDDHAPAFGRRFHSHDPREEGVFQVPEEVVQRVRGDSSRSRRARSRRVRSRPVRTLHHPEAPVPGGRSFVETEGVNQHPPSGTRERRRDLSWRPSPTKSCSTGTASAALVTSASCFAPALDRGRVPVIRLTTMRSYTAVVERCPDTRLDVGYVPGSPERTGRATPSRNLRRTSRRYRDAPR